MQSRIIISDNKSETIELTIGSTHTNTLNIEATLIKHRGYAHDATRVHALDNEDIKKLRR